jgi:uncharacterized repeat protein (TIGR03803 family)
MKLRGIPLILLVFVVNWCAQGFCATQQVLYNFTKHKDGGYPNWGLVGDASGNLYGTTDSGGLGFGTVFELSPDGNGSWTYTVLHAFTGKDDGKYPSGPVMLDQAGNLYGTTQSGGVYGAGVVFELSLQGGSWQETALYSFRGGSDGRFPIAGVIMDNNGNLFGTTYSGFKNATVFEMTAVQGVWGKRVLYRVPTSGAGLTLDAAGNLFLASYYNVFKLTPNSNGTWTPVIIHTSTGYPKDGYWNESAPVFDRAGNLYGCTAAGGRNDEGILYRLVPQPNGTWKEQILITYAGRNGSSPGANLIVDESGNIYGTTSWGGSHAYGTAFELVSSTRGFHNTILWNFDANDGLNPSGSLVLDSAGNLYGTASKGGTTVGQNWGFGVVFKVAP